MSTLYVRMFGRLSIHRAQEIVPGLDAKVQELFCYLLLYRHRSHSREAVAAHLCGDSTTAQSLKGLRQALWQLQFSVGARDDLASQRVVIAEPDSVRLNPDADLWLDVAEFEQAFVATRDVPSLDAAGAKVLRDAVDLYSGDLLGGWYQEWCLCERERLYDLYLAMLDKLMDYSETQAQYETGLEYGARALRCEPACERAHRRMMRLHYLTGDRTAALRQFDRCAATLEEELGVGPARSTLALRDQIRADCLQPPLNSEAATEGGMLPAADLRGQLWQLSAALEDIQRQVQQYLKTIHRALNELR